METRFTLKDCKQQGLRDSKLAQCMGCMRFYLLFIFNLYANVQPMKRDI